MNKKNTMPSRLIELEHELSDALMKVDDQRELLRLAKEENEEKRKDIVWTMGERAKLMDRIKQLEDIIHRASCEFFRDGSDCQTASGMLTILEEGRKP
jgi:predicted ArsR family transcriptional regulator